MRHRPPSRRAQAGFSVLEIAIATTLMAMGLAALGPLLSTTNDLVQDSRIRLRAESENRRSLNMISDVLRNVDIDSLSGFGNGGVATTLKVNRVVGATDAELLWGPTETVAWEATTRPVNGVANPGAIYATTNTGRTLLADRVPQGGFRVVQDGRSLRIELTTYYATSSAHVILVAGETAVSLRN